MEQGGAVKQVAATQMNARSSRSHCCFIVKLQQRKTEEMGTGEAGAENDAAPSPPSPQRSQPEKPVVPPAEEPEDAAGAVFVRGIKQCGDFHVPMGAVTFAARDSGRTQQE